MKHSSAGPTAVSSTYQISSGISWRGCSVSHSAKRSLIKNTEYWADLSFLLQSPLWFHSSPGKTAIRTLCSGLHQPLPSAFIFSPNNYNHICMSFFPRLLQPWVFSVSSGLRRVVLVDDDTYMGSKCLQLHDCMIVSTLCLWQCKSTCVRNIN